MLRTSAYRLKIATDSADSNALILLSDGALVAILVELSDEGHGDARGRWAVEKLFGLVDRRIPANFASAADAATWISDHVCGGPFVLDELILTLG